MWPLRPVPGAQGGLRASRERSSHRPWASQPSDPGAALQLSPLPLGSRSNPHVSAVPRTVLMLPPRLCPWLS